MKKQLIALLLLALPCLVSAQKYFRAGQNDALEIYDLAGTPASYRFRTYELKADSTEGQPRIGEELDTTSDDSFKVYFDRKGKVKRWQYICSGQVDSFIQCYTDHLGKDCSLTVTNNSLSTYDIKETYRPKESKDSHIEVTYTAVRYYQPDDDTNTLQPLRTDSFMTARTDNVIVAQYDLGRSTLHEYYDYDSVMKNDSDYPTAEWFENCAPLTRIIYLYLDGVLAVKHTYDVPTETLVSEDIYHYNENALDSCHEVSYKRLHHPDAPFTEVPGTVTFHQKFRYEYTSPPDEQGNWTSRNVYITEIDGKERPLYHETQTLSYYGPN